MAVIIIIDFGNNKQSSKKLKGDCSTRKGVHLTKKINDVFCGCV